MQTMQIFSKLSFYGRAFMNMHVLRRSELAYLPEYVALEVTNVCNFKCAFCPQSDPKHHEIVPKSYLDKESCALFLRKIREAGITTNLMHWTLDGEPFMNDRFAELVHLSAEYSFTNTHFASNGMLCTVDRLMEFPLDKVRLNIAIDFCADKEFFENVRGTKRSWERVRSNIESILGDPRTQNVGLELTDISSFSEDDPEKLSKAFEALQLLFGQHGNIKYRTRTFHNATGFIRLRTQKTAKKYHLCPYPWTHFRIASNGDIVICCRDLDHKTVLGNLKTQSAAEIWNGAPMLSVRRNLLNETPECVAACKGCDLPFDDSKFTIQNVYRAARGRMQLFST
jgi:MoaA/NifB/PqqE/SkfB family radical SAM enzyme